MDLEDMTVVTTDGTAGLGTASQLVGGTAVPIANADLNLTSLTPTRILRLRRRVLSTAEISMKEPPQWEKKRRPIRARSPRSHQDAKRTF
jgi:hypothetical protein